jgi:Icc-related predicted phosphoesterase
MIRLAAVGDVHAGLDSGGVIRPTFERLDEEADVLLLAGDLTKSGTAQEAAVLAGEFDGLATPVIAVLGNHDHHSDEADQVRAVLLDAGICVLEGETEILQIEGTTVGIVGAKGFGGGFEGTNATEFGEPEMKAFIRHTTERAEVVEAQLAALTADIKILLLHYAPVRNTLIGEPPEIFPFLGSYLFAESADRHDVDLIVHGHAHRGVEQGLTHGGVAVRNVAQPVLRRPYAVYEFPPERRGKGVLERAAVTEAVGRG